jgi:hypothetical protein
MREIGHNPCDWSFAQSAKIRSQVNILGGAPTKVCTGSPNSRQRRVLRWCPARKQEAADEDKGPPKHPTPAASSNR